MRVGRLFASPLLTFCRYECGAAGKDATDEHFPRGPTLIMPHAVPFVLWHRGRDTVIDPNSYVLMNAAELYRAKHPFGCGDRGSALVLRPEALAGLMAEIDASAADRPDQPFRQVRIASSPAACVSEGLLAKLTAADGGGEALELEELALDLARRAFAGLSVSAAPPRAQALRSRERDLCEAVKEILARRLGRSVSLTEIATALGVSASYLERTFRRVTGCAVYRYSKRLRLREALRRVVERDCDLSRLAHDLGFSSHSHLTAAFRAEFGVTPRSLRRTASARTVRGFL
ncbi:MAG: AraC family transcriptional regulator [Vicinamibacteria bacterium]